MRLPERHRRDTSGDGRVVGILKVKTDDDVPQTESSDDGNSAKDHENQGRQVKAKATCTSEISAGVLIPKLAKEQHCDDGVEGTECQEED